VKFHHRWAGVAVFVAALFGVLTTPAWAVGYTITDLGTLGGTISDAYGINNNGQVVGYASTAGDAVRHAFLYRNGAMTDLGALGGTESWAYGINNTGQVVGSATTADGSGHAFLYSNGTMADLGTLGGSGSRATGINNTGQVVGTLNTGSVNHAFLYSNGTMSDLGILGGAFSAASGINNNGQVVGWAYTTGNTEFRAFLYSNGAVNVLGTLGGGLSLATGINNNGQVVGWATTAAGIAPQHAFLYSNGTMADLGTLGGGAGAAWGINNNGQVVGDDVTAGGVEHAFLYSNGKMTDLNSLLPLGSGWFSLFEANAINDVGQIVGAGIINGQTHAFLMTPTNTTKRPVIIIPGIMGTELYRADSNTEVYPSTCTLITETYDQVLFPLLLQSDGITPDTNSYCASNEKICTTNADCPLTSAGTYTECTPGGAADIQPEGPLTLACSGVTIYDAYTKLSNFLRDQGGYLEGTNLFTYGYDWRLDLAGEATKLHNFLADTSKFPDQSVTVDVVAHSMGGLLIRAYLQRYPTDQRIHSIIYLGTPQLGTPMAYAILKGTTSLVDKAGGTFKALGAEWLNLNTETFLVKYFPGVYDLLPRFGFIGQESSAGNISYDEPIQTSFLSLPDNSLVTKANNLYNSGLATSDRVPRSFAINGTGQETLRGFDFTNSQCPGAIVDLSGDGTVPTDSYGAFLSAGAEWYVNVDHKDLPGNSSVQQKILNILNDNGQENVNVSGILSSPVAGSDAWSWKSCSPIRTHITDAVGNTDGLDSDGNLYEEIPDSTHLRFTENEGGFMPFDQTYTVNIVATDNGLFTLEFDHLASPNSNVIASTSYKGIPISAQSHAQLILSPTNTTPNLNLDVDGDGVVDFTIAPNTPPQPSIFPAVLINMVQNFNLPHGISRSLLAKLREATEALGHGERDDARENLRAFLHEVAAQRGKKLSDKQANTLTALATSAIKALSAEDAEDTEE
jgi:probable HAF family extracellular repeat protein